jgi:hypothetical protein
MSGPIKCSILGAGEHPSYLCGSPVCHAQAPLRIPNTLLPSAGLSLQAFHYPFIATYPELFSLHSVLERSATASKSSAREFTGIEGLKVVNTLEEVTGDDEVELVVISTPNLSHFEYAKKCLSAGKHGQSHSSSSLSYTWRSPRAHFSPRHPFSATYITTIVDDTAPTPTHTTLTVLIEKPLTPTYAEATELIGLAKEKNLILAPFQNRRWDADFLAVKGLLKEEKVRSDDFTHASSKRRG